VSKLPAKQQREHEIRQMRKDYKQLVLQVLFIEEQVKVFQKNKEMCFITEELTRIWDSASKP
jgi:hypothetical protein